MGHASSIVESFGCDAGRWALSLGIRQHPALVEWTSDQTRRAASIVPVLLLLCWRWHSRAFLSGPWCVNFCTLGGQLEGLFGRRRLGDGFSDITAFGLRRPVWIQSSPRACEAV